MMRIVNRKHILVLSIVLILLAACGTTYAILKDATASKANTFTPSKVSCAVEETFNNSLKKDVSIKNTGDADAYIRAAVVATWQDADGNVYGETPVAGTDYSITYNLSSGWSKDSSDGYYYWANAVTPGNSTGILITSANEISGKAPDGYHLCIEILASAVQDGGGAKADAW